MEAQAKSVYLGLPKPTRDQSDMLSLVHRFWCKLIDCSTRKQGIELVSDQIGLISDNSVWSLIDVELTLNAQQLGHPSRLFTSLHLNTIFALVLCYYRCSFCLILQSVSRSSQANTLHPLQLAVLHLIFSSAVNRKQKRSPPTLLASSPMLSFWHPSSPPLTALEWQWCAHSFSPQFKSATEWPSELDYVRWRTLLFLVSGDLWGFTRQDTGWWIDVLKFCVLV